MFLAHKSDLAEGQWRVLEQTQGRQVLVNDQGRYYTQSNICPHQGSRIRCGHGEIGSVSCPYHGWSWNQDGQPRGSGTVGRNPGSTACRNVHPLETKPAYEWSGFLFSKPVPAELDISGDYELVEYRQDHIKSSRVPVMDIFLDIDHIPIVHPGVYDQINVPRVDNIVWQTWDGGSIQMVPGVSDTDPVWSEFVKGRGLTHSAAWLALYPDTMFEWQPGAVFIMVNQALSDTETRSHIFKYRDRSYSQENWLINERVWELAWQQDCEQSEFMEPGWRASSLLNLDVEKQKWRQWLADNPQ